MSSSYSVLSNKLAELNTDLGNYTHFLDDKYKSAILILLLLAYTELSPARLSVNNTSISSILSKLIVFFLVAYICTRDVVTSIVSAVIVVFVVIVLHRLNWDSRISEHLSPAPFEPNSESDNLREIQTGYDDYPSGRAVHFAEPVVDQVGYCYDAPEFASANHSVSPTQHSNYSRLDSESHVDANTKSLYNLYLNNSKLVAVEGHKPNAKSLSIDEKKLINKVDDLVVNHMKNNTTLNPTALEQLCSSVANDSVLVKTRDPPSCDRSANLSKPTDSVCAVDGFNFNSDSYSAVA